MYITKSLGVYKLMSAANVGATFTVSLGCAMHSSWGKDTMKNDTS